MDVPWAFLSLLSGLIVIIIAWIHHRQKYWQNHNVFTPEYKFFIGHVSSVLSQSEPFGNFAKNFYFTLRKKQKAYGGLYMFWSPVFVPTDPEIVKNIMQNDFNHFVDRGVYYNEEADPLSAHLFALNGSKWKNLRTKLTPTFTSGKMKMMFNTLVQTGDQLKALMDDKLNAGPMNIKDSLVRFTMDIIGSCAFGIDCNTLKDPNSEFSDKAKLFINREFWDNLKGMIVFISPSLGTKLGLTVVNPKLSKFFMRTVKETVDYREQNNVFRKDFMHLLIQLKNRGKLYDDDNLLQNDTDTSGKDKVSLTFNEVVAQAMVFFLAGFETSSTTMTFCLYELASNPKIQEHVRNEIDEVLARHNNEITYEAIGEMHYMEKVINETLRKYPPLPVLNRVCTKEYLVPGTDLVLNEGVKLLIPIIGLHYDEEYYPNPEQFNPERFSPENVAKRPPFTFLPFGEGPRVCIGLRFGMMQTKVGLTILLKNYRFRVSSKTPQPLVMDPKSFILSVKDGMWLDYTKV